MIILAIDPGKDCALAFFDNAKLVACSLTDGDDPIVAPFRVERVYCERPGFHRAPSDDLVTVGLRAGMAAGRARAPVTWIRPATWKGSLPKDVSNQRVLDALSPNERDIFADARGDNDRRVQPSKRHNLLDAIGIGLFALTRHA